jgi:class 3 adenylate cyclase
VTDLADWLAGIGLAEYAATFAEQEIDFELLPLLTEADVRELGLPIGARRKLLGALAALRSERAVRSEAAERRSEAERRQLTVMFVDLAQSTPLALRLDPEAMGDVLRAFQDAVTVEISRLGYVAKLMGDGVLAYFGWPRAHENDAQRAVAAALAITEAVAGLASPTGEKLACRIGIATGMVVVGELVGQGVAQEHTVVGPTPNLAARLLEAAGPGEIMIAEMTRRLLGSAFVVESIGERLLKGHKEPVALFRVLRQELRETPFLTRGAVDLGPMFGREVELALLRNAWEQAKSGRGGTVLLTGEAGIGKSRLVQALTGDVAADNPALQVFQCSPLHRENPLWPVVRAFPAMASMIERPAGGSDRRGSRHDIAQTTAGELLRFARRGPTLLVFEDAQWADRATTDLLRLLVEAVAGTPALLIVTGRLQGELRLGAAPSLVQLALGRLDGAAAAALLAATAGRHPLPGRLTTEILARSDGVPLFIEEMTKAIIETATGGGAVTVPATLRDSLIARLDASPTMKAAAQIASCIGRDFGERLLFQVADFPQDELQEGLTALLGAGLVLATSAGQFRFKHALVCDIAYESLLTPRRQKLHQRIAEAIEAMPGATAENEPETLAHHWFAAGQDGRAEPYWLRARHRVAHWQEQLDALADYLETGGGEVIPFPRPAGPP